MFASLASLLACATDRRGVTAMEYALIGSLIAVAIITALTTTGLDIGNVFNSVANSL